MNEYRTPEEDQISAEHEARIQAVLDRVVRDFASCKVAMKLGEPPAVVERWVNTMWDGLRDNTTDGKESDTLRLDDRLTAILMLLDDRASAEAESILRGMREAGDA